MAGNPLASLRRRQNRWFTLRDDVAFSNGEPFNAQAAAANFQAVLANRQRHAGLSSPTK